jgi:hypothetical protein
VCADPEFEAAGLIHGTDDYRPAYVGAMRAEADEDPAIKELAAAGDSDELCRLLVRSPWEWGSSTRHSEAVSLLRAAHGRGTLPGSLVALLLCTCHRWDRVTAKLIAAIDDSGLLSSVELDELAESVLSDEVVAVFPLAWVSPAWLEFDTAEGTTRTVKVSDDMVARDRRRLEPPLRRWAAARALRNDPGRLDGLLEGADGLPPRHRDALLHGLLDVSASLPAGQRRQLVRRALRSGIARSAARRWTGCASSTARKRRCAVRPPTQTGRCGPGARPAGQNRASHRCQACTLMQDPTFGDWEETDDEHRGQMADRGDGTVGFRRPEPGGARIHRVRGGRVGQLRLHRRPRGDGLPGGDPGRAARRGVLLGWQ